MARRLLKREVVPDKVTLYLLGVWWSAGASVPPGNSCLPELPHNPSLNEILQKLLAHKNAKG